MCSRSSSWVHPDGDETSVSFIVASLEAHKTWLAQVGARRIYDGTDMKTGVDFGKLQNACHVLQSMCRIDPRGGMLVQSHLSQALKAMMSDDELKPLFLAQNEVVYGAGADDFR